jgi:uncharacterized protein GlcG (DUF336 family)
MEGGLPDRRDRLGHGAIGASLATPEEDELVARAGLAALGQ